MPSEGRPSLELKRECCEEAVGPALHHYSLNGFFLGVCWNPCDGTVGGPLRRESHQIRIDEQELLARHGVDGGGDDQPDDCVPDPLDPHKCTETTCPEPTDICVPVRIRLSGTDYAVLECECLPTSACHVAIQPGALQPYCVGQCEDPGSVRLWQGGQERDAVLRHLEDRG